MNLHGQQLQEKTPLLQKKEGKLKDPIPPLPTANKPIATVPGTIAIIFPATSFTPASIPITSAINNTPVHTNNVTVVKPHHGNHAMSDNINVSNESYFKGGIGDVNYFDSLVVVFHNANEIMPIQKINSIAKNSSSDDAFTPPTKKSKITDTQDTPPKQK